MSGLDDSLTTAGGLSELGDGPLGGGELAAAAASMTAPTAPPAAAAAAVTKAVWPSTAGPHPDRKLLTVWYTVVVGCMGLTMGAQGPATLKLATQCGFVTVTVNATDGTETLDTTNLPLMGVATGFDALAGVVGCLCGAALIEKFPAWHYMLLGCMVWTGLAFGAWTAVWDFGSMLVAATAWGLLSVVPTQTTQAALTWVWGADCAPHISVLNAGFGLGSLVAPILVSLDLSATNSFHNAYWAIGLANILCGIPLLCYPSPQSNDKGDSNAPALTFKEPAHWRKMLTGRESQAEPGGQWQLWALWYSFFFWYVVCEVAFSAWISPFATLVGLEDQASAALLTTAYYVPYTAVRAGGFVVSKHLPSERLFWLSFGCSCLSLVVVLVAVTLSSSSLLWFGTCAFGLFCGPLWPSLMSLLSEKHGVELRATQLAVVFVLTKLAIAVEQATFSVIITHCTSCYIPAVGFTLVLSGLCAYAMTAWALPRSGLK